MVYLEKRLALYTFYFLTIALITGWGLCVCFAQDEKSGRPPAAEKENTGNNLCYTCHLGLKNEKITAKHIAHNITCALCHGPSVEHMHDEMQVTKPDVLHGRGEVARMCSACHAGHKNPDKVAAFRAEWLGKTRPNGRVITANSICTDCHGSHNYIEKTANAAPAPEEKWLPLFNGENLDGWQTPNPHPDAWSVKMGRIVANSTPDANACLWTKDRYADYKLSVTFRADAAARASISIASIDSDNHLRLDLFDRPEKGIFAPTLSINGKAILLANIKKDLADSFGWNTVIAELNSDTCTITINDEKVGSVCVKTPLKTPVGLYMEKSDKSAQVSFSEIYIQSLSPAEEKPEDK